MRTSVKITLGGVIAALSVALMFLTNVIPFGTYAFPAFAGMLLTVMVIEMGYGWAVSVFFAVSVLSFLTLADKEAALFYAAFFGFYPILKSLIERIGVRVIQVLLKLLLFNIAMTAAFYIGLFVLSVPKESFYIFGVYLPWVFLILGNGLFILYDVCVTKIVTVYLLKWRKRFLKNTKL